VDLPRSPRDRHCSGVGFRARASAKGAASSPISANKRAPISGPKPGKLAVSGALSWVTNAPSSVSVSSSTLRQTASSWSTSARSCRPIADSTALACRSRVELSIRHRVAASAATRRPASATQQEGQLGLGQLCHERQGRSGGQDYRHDALSSRCLPPRSNASIPAGLNCLSRVRIRFVT
jgi:hypothetical protein